MSEEKTYLVQVPARTIKACCTQEAAEKFAAGIFGTSQIQVTDSHGCREGRIWHTVDIDQIVQPAWQPIVSVKP